MRLLVAQNSECAYCIELNTGILVGMLGWPPEQVAAVRADPGAARFPDAERALLAFVVKAVRASNSMTANDLDGLRALGWTDADILDATVYAARMVAADTVINAFRVERDF